MNKLSDEIWRTTLEDENIEVSSLGNVRRKSYTIQLKGNTTEIPAQILRPMLYGRYLYVNFGNKSFPVHRLVAEAFIDNPNNYSTVIHKDGNALNNSVNNLEWSSRSNNMKNCRKSDSYNISSGRSIKMYCKETDTTYLNVKQGVSEIKKSLDIPIQYDTLLRHLQKADFNEEIGLKSLHFQKIK